MSTCLTIDWPGLHACDARTAARCAALAAIQRAAALDDSRAAGRLRRRALRLLAASSDPSCPLMITAAACAALAGQ
jgi:hypothetical protein